MNTFTPVLPDYQGGSLVNLMASVGGACGLKPGAALPYAPLSGLPAAALSRCRNLVLLVVDGLGYSYLVEHSRGPLGRHLRSHLTSVFPSTTASAVTTLMTGLPPAGHGLTGWHVWLEELQAVTAILPLVPRSGGRFPGDAQALPGRLFDHPSFVSRLERTAYGLSPAAIAPSPFNRHHLAGGVQVPYQDLEDMLARVVTLAADPGPKYIYAYWPDLDATAHRHGVASPETLACFQAFETAFAAWLKVLEGSDTLVLVTADHGFVDCPPERTLRLEDHPDLAHCLARPLCGERRLPYCYLKPETEERFCAYVNGPLAPYAQAVSREKLLAEGWYGPGPVSPRLASRVGDYVLLMKDNWTLVDRVPGETPYTLVGVHGGVSPAEMLVPLVVARA